MRMIVLFRYSGSTTDPKTVDHSIGGYMLYSRVSFRYILDFNVGDKDWKQEEESDVCLTTADLGWIYGLTVGLCAPLLNGGATIRVLAAVVCIHSVCF